MKMLAALSLVVALYSSSVAAFSPIAPQASGRSSVIELQESFGLGIGEDTYENQPALLRGEQEYKQFINKYKEDNMLNRKVRPSDTTNTLPVSAPRPVESG